MLDHTEHSDDERRRRRRSLKTRHVVYHGRIFRLEIDRVQLPSGHTVDMEIVRHPGSVVLLPMPAPERDHPDSAVPLHDRSLDLGAAGREPEAGRRSGRRPPRVSARRKSASCRAASRRMRSFYPTPGFCDEEMIFYRCTDLQQPAADSTAQKDEDEDLEPRTFTLEEARRLVDRRRDRRSEDCGGVDAALTTAFEGAQRPALSRRQAGLVTAFRLASWIVAR